MVPLPLFGRSVFLEKYELFVSILFLEEKIQVGGSESTNIQKKSH